jgi:sugar/nucleoside kinase (ribokinase family)
MSVLIAGSIALDHIKTPTESSGEVLGGSASYAAVAAAFSCPVNLMGIVGADFPDQHAKLLRSRDINLDGVEVVPDGKTFRWSGEYFGDLNSRETLDVHLNVLAHYSPELNASYRRSQIVLLANAGPDSQLKVLRQCEAPVFTIADTMDLWITTMRDELQQLLGGVDMLVINDSEARQLTETTNLIQAGEKMIAMGPRYVILKKGEHGSLLFGRNGEFFTTGAYPLRAVHDPTGAGDSFIGGLAGYLGSLGKKEIELEDLAEGILLGTVTASFTCEEFGLRKLASISQAEILARRDAFRSMARLR